MKFSEFFSSALKGAQDAGITIEADEAAPGKLVPTADPIQMEPITTAADQDALKARVEEQQAVNAALQARIAAMEQDARTAKFAALAKGWHGETAAHVRMLELCAANGGETGEPFTGYAALQNGIAETLRQNKVFSTIGSDQAGAGSAWSQIESRAKAAMAADSHLTMADATVQVMDADPGLYRQYMAEQQ